MYSYYLPSCKVTLEMKKKKKEEEMCLYISQTWIHYFVKIEDDS